MNIWEFHPALLHFPLTFLLSSTVLEIVARRRRRADVALAAFCLLLAGVLTAIVVAFTGVVAYFTVPPHSEAANDRILLHAFAALSAASFYSFALFLRWRNRHRVASRFVVVLSVIGTVLLFVAGSLGGWLVYHDGVGVTAPGTNAFE